MLQLVEIQNRIEQIEQSKRDPELAHALEDRLLKDFIRELHDSTDPHVAILAEQVMTVDKIQFPRFTA